ncbi:RNA 3'-terminal phosphate cyclase [Penicillium brevicompactum]
MAQPSPARSGHVYLNGRTLEGGGQLVRIAIGLSALTGRPVSIDNIRGNRKGKKGLKRSHVAAVQLLAEISGSKISGGEVDSQVLNFFPQSPRSRNGPLVDRSQVTVKSKYDIELTTAGSICLIFQALYPYLLHIGSQASAPFIQVKMTGGTNTSKSPSFDYLSQVILPNFEKLGLPPVSVALERRGWSSGPYPLGIIVFYIQSLGSRYPSINWNDFSKDGDEERSAYPSKFPKIDLMAHEPGKITQIDLTVLAPDYKTIYSDVIVEEEETLLEYIEQTTRQELRRAMNKVNPSVFRAPRKSSHNEDSLNGDTEPKSPVPIRVHTSERTWHESHVYILLVAHTSSGFRIGHEVLSSLGNKRPPKPKTKGRDKQRPANDDWRRKLKSDLFNGATELIKRCVEGFIQEISNGISVDETDKEKPVVRKACLDQHMRDQIVVFEALGEACHAGTISEAADGTPREDGRDWTLHTRTAQWTQSGCPIKGAGLAAQAVSRL